MAAVLTVAVLVILALWLGYERGKEAQRGGEPTPPARSSRVSLVSHEPVIRRQSPAVSRTTARTPIPGRSAIVVRPAPTTLWQEKGWTVRGTKLRGQYEGPRGKYEGRIENHASPRPKFYIRNPPRGLEAHRHAACFMPRGDGWRFVHFGRKPREPDSGIRTIERILHEIRW